MAGRKPIGRPFTKEQIEELADRIYKLFSKNGLWYDTRIYFNGGCIDNRDGEGRYRYDGVAYHHPDRDPRDYFAFVNPDHILSMSFEGPVYHMFHYGKYRSVKTKFKKLLERFGVYYELGDAWNLTLYYMQKE